MDGPTKTTYFDWLLNKGHILFRLMFESIDFNTHSPNGLFSYGFVSLSVILHEVLLVKSAAMT